MKRSFFISLSLLLLLTILPAKAQNCLVLELRDGSSNSYLFEQKPQVTFADGQVRIVSTEMETTAAMSDVLNFHFADVETGVPSLKEKECRIAYGQGTVTVEGCKGAVSLYDMSGNCLQTLNAKASGSINIDLNTFAGKIFILKAERQTVKLIKK